MSRTAQGVIAVKQCRFPPLGYRIDVLGAVRTLSAANLASLTETQGHGLEVMCIKLKPNNKYAEHSIMPEKNCSTVKTTYCIVETISSLTCRFITILQTKY